MRSVSSRSARLSATVCQASARQGFEGFGGGFERTAKHVRQTVWRNDMGLAAFRIARSAAVRTLPRSPTARSRACRAGTRRSSRHCAAAARDGRPESIAVEPPRLEHGAILDRHQQRSEARRPARQRRNDLRPAGKARQSRRHRRRDAKRGGMPAVERSMIGCGCSPNRAQHVPPGFGAVALRDRIRW